MADKERGISGKSAGGSSSAGKPSGGSKVGLSPIQLQGYLKGLQYPASKADLVTRAKSGGAGESVVSLLGKLPDVSYKSPIDVSREVGKLR